MDFVHLHTWSWFSFLRGASSPKALLEQAQLQGQTALALTDYMSVAGAVQFQVEARKVGIKAIIGAEINLAGCPLVLLCANQAGYATLNRLLTQAHQQDRDNPVVSLEHLSDGAFDFLDSNPIVRPTDPTVVVCSSIVFS